MHALRNLFTLLGSLVIAAALCQAQSAGSGGNSSGGTNAASSGQRSRPTSAPVAQPAAGGSGTSTINNLDLPATDPGYHLSNGDEIAVIVWGEADVSTDQRIDSKGVVRMPLIGDVNLSSRTVREAEKYLEQVYIDKKILRKPMVTISATTPSARLPSSEL